MQHEQFQDILDILAERSTVGQELLGEVLTRTLLRAPGETSRQEIAAGNPTARRPVDQRALPQGTVSKAVRILLEEGFLEYGEKLLLNADGRALAPVRMGSRFVTAGVKVERAGDRPRHVTTALFGLDGTRMLGTTHGAADTWDHVAELVHRHVASLMSECDRDRASDGLVSLQIFGVGIEVGAPVHNGEVMPHLSDLSGHRVPLAEKLHGLFEEDPRFDRPVPVMVENDANALAVLAINQIHYADPDLVVVGIFEDGVRGGLVMDGRLRRGGNGRAMEIGHVVVGIPSEHQSFTEVNERAEEPHSTNSGFRARCECGAAGHLDTLAGPQRILEELGRDTLKDAGEVDSRNSNFQRTCEVFTYSGAALGRALAHVSNTVNPTRVIIYLPAALAHPKPGTAAEAFTTAVSVEVTSAFAARDQPDYLVVRSFPAKAPESTLLGARAAALCVMETFIEHALRLDDCKTGLRRSANLTKTAGK